MKNALVLLLVTTAIASTAHAQDDPAARIKARIELEMKDALAQTRKRIRELVREEVAGALFAAKVDGFAKSLIEDTLHDRLRALLLTKEGKKLVEEFMTEQQMDSVDGLIEAYFEKDKAGRYRVIEDFEEVLAQLLDGIELPAPGSIGIDLVIDRARPAVVGLRVAAVTAGGPAASAGLKAGDVVLSVGGRDLTSATVEEIMKSLAPGQDVTIVYEREKAKTTVTVKAK